MIEIELTKEQLTVHVKGIDRFLAFKTQIDVPLTHVESAEVGVPADVQEEFDKSWRLPGAYMPGIAIAGSYYHDGNWLFYAIHKGTKTITVKLTHESYNALVVEVEDPEATVKGIREALAGAKGAQGIATSSQ